MKKILRIVLLALSALLFVSCGTKTIDVKDYVNVEYSPTYNGYANPQLVIDKEGLNSALDQKKTEKFVQTIKDSNRDYSELDYFFNDTELGFTDFFAIEFADYYHNLKNDDVMKAKVSLNSRLKDLVDLSFDDVANNLGIKIFSNEFEITVNGLEEIKTVDVDLNKLIKVDFGEYNGYASPTLEIDYDYFKTLIVPEVYNDYVNRADTVVQYVLALECQQWFTAVFDQEYSNLKNGDTIKTNIVLNNYLDGEGFTLADFNKYLGINFNGGSNEYTVEGLPEPKNVVDLFEGIEQYIEYNGPNDNCTYVRLNFPKEYSRQVGEDLYFVYGYPNIKVIYKNRCIGSIFYSIDKGYKGNRGYIKKGDEIEITASFDSSILEELGYVISTTHITTTVPDLGEYLISKEQLTPGSIAAIKDRALELINICFAEDTINEMYIFKYSPGVQSEYGGSPSFLLARGLNDSSIIISPIIIKPDGTVECTFASCGFMDDENLDRAMKDSDYEYVERFY